MGKENEKHLSLRVNREIQDKFRYASSYMGRSVNRQMIWLMLQFIANYEKAHGEIVLDKQED